MYQPQLLLLVEYIKKVYAPATQELVPLLVSDKITYDLLWALFKPNSIVYGKCLGTDKPRCIKFDFGEVKTLSDGNEYFHIEGRYWDYNGQFGEAKTALAIFKFRGAKRISSLEAFPLEYHDNIEEEKSKLVGCGEKFVSLMGVHHVQYQGNAFSVERGEIVKVFVDGRIMVDASHFQEMNPNYVRPRVDELCGKRPAPPTGFWNTMIDPTNEIKPVDAESGDLSKDDLLLCSPTVLGYSLNKKQWRKFGLCSFKCKADRPRYSGVCC
jgi:hypothetical protein